MRHPSDKSELLHLLESGWPLPESWRAKLFPASGKTVEIGKEYRLEYEGEMKREQVLAETPAAPWQLVRRFNTNDERETPRRLALQADAGVDHSRSRCLNFLQTWPNQDI